MLGHMLPMTIVVLSHMMSIPPSAAAPHNLLIPLPILPSLQLEKHAVTPMDLQTIRRDEKSYDDSGEQSGSSWEEPTSSIIDRYNNDHENNRPQLLQRPFNRQLIEAATKLVDNGGGGNTQFGDETSPDSIDDHERDLPVMKRRVNVNPSEPEVDTEGGSNLIRMESFTPSSPFDQLRRQQQEGNPEFGYNIGHHGIWNFPIPERTRERDYSNGQKDIIDENEDNGVGNRISESKRQGLSYPSGISTESLDFWIPKAHSPQTYEDSTLDNDSTGAAASDMLTFIPKNEKRSPKCLRRCLAQGLLHPSQCHSLC